MNSQHIRELRAFNRFYTNIIGLLDGHFLNSKYSLPEVRVMFELNQNPDLTASDIIAMIDIDKGYLSRILRKLEKERLLVKMTSAADSRALALRLSAKGKKEFDVLNRASDKQIEHFLKALSDRECDELLQMMSRIKKLLTNVSKNG